MSVKTAAAYKELGLGLPLPAHPGQIADTGFYKSGGEIDGGRIAAGTAHPRDRVREDYASGRDRNST
jgi:hypothetical protein